MREVERKREKGVREVERKREKGGERARKRRERGAKNLQPTGEKIKNAVEQIWLEENLSTL